MNKQKENTVNQMFSGFECSIGFHIPCKVLVCVGACSGNSFTLPGSWEVMAFCTEDFEFLKKKKKEN